MNKKSTYLLGCPSPINVELFDQLAHDAIGIEAMSKQLPYPCAGLVELKDAVRGNMNEYGSLTQALRDDLRIGP